MAERGWHKGVSRWGAPFALWLLLFASAAPAGADGTCVADRHDDRGTVDYVYDGDTLRLADGRKVRVIGINTPELGRDGAADEPLAVDARQAVRALARKGSEVTLRFGTERRDRYGRLLAHVYLPDGTSLGATLLDRGLATTLVVPPNTWNHRCYAEVEARAREQGRGVWALERYRPVDSRTLGRAEGYRLVQGEVLRVGQSRSSVWLNLEGDVALRIPREDLKNFTGFDPRELAGRRVLAKGWLHLRKGELRMTVRHPAAMEITD